jgi:hypothetical protein
MKTKHETQNLMQGHMTSHEFLFPHIYIYIYIRVTLLGHRPKARNFEIGVMNVMTPLVMTS